MLLISDLHLEPRREDISRSLVNFLQGRATTAASLYILGDLFEAWIGDDDPNPLADRVANELARLHEKGVQVFLLHGNRDFLIGEDFAARCKASLIHEPLIITTPSQRIALMHGDTLCTRDVEYMKFRTLVRNPLWQQDFLSKPLEERVEFARRAREQSRKATSTAASEIMDVSPAEVMDTFKDLQINTLIHGHTHRPAIHSVQLEEPVNGSLTAKRIVLGDWDSEAWFAEIRDRDVLLEQFPLSG